MLSDTTNHFLRHTNPLHVPLTNKNYRKFALSICGPDLWNKTCGNIDVKEISMASFKKYIKNLLNNENFEPSA